VHLHIRFPKRLAGTAAIAAAAALIPVAALAATVAPAAPAAPATPLSLLASGPGQAAKMPAGFQPASASFYSPATGVVLGAVGCRPQQACQARLAATTDGGARWHYLKAPDVRLFNSGGDLLDQATRVSGVVFTSRLAGWLYGPGLYSTRDGGAHWRRIFLRGGIRPSLGGGVVAMAVSSGTAYAVVSPDPFNGTPDELFASPAGRDAWARVDTMTGEQAVLAVSGQAAWFGTSTDLWATADGVHWHKYSFRCPGADYRLSGIAAASGSRVVFLCTNAEGMFHTNKEVLRSINGGRTEHLTGYAPVGGDEPFGGNGGIAVPPHRSRVITIAAYSPGPDYLYRSANGGKAWAQITAPGTEGGVNLSSLSYVSRTVGWVVAGGPGGGSQNRLLRTSNAGVTWQTVRFSSPPRDNPRARCSCP
jgi:photosystem II stability/assembly factor-like uncharacterized protein